jgi:hypothetical protein
MTSSLRKFHPGRRGAPLTSGNILRDFDREAELPRLIGVWPSELRTASPDAAARIVALLRKAIRSERQRGRAGHWTYDLNRHLALAEALKAEQARLREAIKADNKVSSGVLQ